MSKVTFDYSKACGFVQDHEMQYMSELAEQAKEKLLARTGAGNDFLGWIDLPVDYDKDEFDRIKKAAEKIREPKCRQRRGRTRTGQRASADQRGDDTANTGGISCLGSVYLLK